MLDRYFVDKRNISFASKNIRIPAAETPTRKSVEVRKR